jgi:hypothetical protein
MAKQKHYVFSARTTEEGLRLLNELKKERNVGWDDLVLDAVCALYGLDTLAMFPPKVYRLYKPTKPVKDEIEPKQPTEDVPPKKTGKAEEAAA